MIKKLMMKVFAILGMAMCTILPALAMEFGPICMYDDGWYMYGHSVGMTESWSKLLIPVENVGKNDVVEPIIIYGSATPDKIASVKVIADAVMKRDVEAADYADWWEFADSFWPYDEPSSSRKWIVVSMKDSKEWSGAYSFRVGLKGTDLYSDEMNIVGFEDAPIKPMDAFGLNITGFQWWGEGYWFESRSDTIILSITVPSAGVLKIDKPFYYRGEDGVKTLKAGGSVVSDVKYGEDLYPYDDYTCVLEDLTITTSGRGVVTLKVSDNYFFQCANIVFYPEGKHSVGISAKSEDDIIEDGAYGLAGYTCGYVTGGGTFAKGSRVTLTAVPGNGEVFDRWVQVDDYGNEISTVALSEAQLTSPTLSFVVTDSMVGSAKESKKLNFCATWKEKYDVMGISSPIGAGTISGGGSYVPGSDFVLSLKDLNSLSTFKYWKDNPSVTSPVRLIVSEDQDVIYTAVYGSLPRLTINCEDGGSVTGSGIFPAGKTVNLKATANKGYVFAGWFTADGEPVSGASDYRSPSYSYVTTGEDITLVAKFIPIADDVADISFTMHDEYKLGMAIEPVLIDVSGCTSLPMVKVSGLPAGLKFTAKPIYKKGSKTEIEVPANTIYGTPTKSGVYTIVATVTTAGKKMATCSQTVIVRKEGEKVVVAECDAAGGKVKGAGVYATGKKVALKATANKGYVFAGWYEDEAFTTPCDSTVVDYRTASYAYTMGNEDKTFYARFIPSVEDSLLDLTVNGKTVPTTFTISEYAWLKFDVDSLSLPKISVKGLPTGMKFTAKPIYKKGSKTEIEVPANTIYGAPTKPELKTVTVSISNQSIKKAIVKEFSIEVPNLTGANDYFVEDIDNGIGKKCVLSVGITNLDDFLPNLKLKSNIAKLAVSGLPSGLKYDAKIGKITGIATKAGTYTGTLTVTDGKAKYVSTITIEVEALPDWVVGTFYGKEIARGIGYSEWVCPMQITVAISAVGKISIKGIEPGESGTSRSAQLTEVRDDGSYAFTAHHVSGRKGNDGYTEGDLEGVITPMVYGDNVEFGCCIIHDVGVCDEDDDPYESDGETYQSLYYSKSHVSKLPAFVKNAVTTVNMNYMRDDDWVPYYGGYLTLKYGANGAVTTAYSETKGGKATATGSAQLVPYEVNSNITKAWLYTALKPKGRDPFGVLLFLSINTSNGNIYGDDVTVDDYLLEVDD